MSGAEVFPLPPDDPQWLREVGGLLAGTATGVGEATTKVRGSRTALVARWVTPAGQLAVAEVDAIAGLGDAAGTALVDAEGPLQRYATAVEVARTTIAGLQRRYDDADAALLAVTSVGPVSATVLDDARTRRFQELARLHHTNAAAVAELARAARQARQELMAIAGRISPMPESRDPLAARAGALERLPFMTAHDGTTVLRLDGMVLVDTGDGDDDIRVRHDPARGTVTLFVNGQAIVLTTAEAARLVIRTNGGDDTIRVDPGITLELTFLAGAGSDTVRSNDGDDVVLAGDGRDVVDAGAGNDLVFGDGGSDILHAGEGEDIVDGGAGDDYIDGYRGDDRLYGGDGDDVVSGGAGRDLIDGDGGDDVVYAGAGHDVVIDDQGANTVYAEVDDQVEVDAGAGSTVVTVEMATIPANVVVEGDPAFVARVQADLETLASSPTGQAMLRALGEQAGTPRGGTLRIQETPDPGGWFDSSVRVILYNPSFAPPNWGPTLPPVIVLQHEMVHAYNTMSGTHMTNVGASQIYVGPDAEGTTGRRLDVDGDGLLTRAEVDRDHDGDVDRDDLDLNDNGSTDDDGWLRNSERQAVGLPVDHDADPGTPDVPASTLVDHPAELTENALRAEMGLPPREHYRLP